MDILDLKEYILEHDLVETILDSLGCHSIKRHSGNPDSYYSCANPDGDNPQAVTVYLNEYLPCINYTRNISKKNVTPDIFSLVEFYNDMSFFEAFKYICSVVGIDVYHDFSKELPKSLQLTKTLSKMNKHGSDDIDTPINPIPEKILNYYYPYVNDLFKDDGISYKTQREFEIGYDPYTNRITIPIRSEHGDLVGVKGRVFECEYKGNYKYIYLEKCPRNKILYGLYKTYEEINLKGSVFVGESEKSCMQLWDMGYKNCVGIGGKMISKTQIEKLERLGANVILCFDKDVTQEELESIADKFMPAIEVLAIIDTDNILDEHESPSDNKEKFKTLLKNNLFKIR